MFKKAFYILFIINIISFLTAIYFIFSAPNEAMMGIVQKIFYFHMPSAVISMFCFFGSFIFSIVYLIKKKTLFDNISAAFVETGVVLATFVIISGPLWAKKSWGVFWTWDTRLTFTLIMWMIYISYLIVRTSDLDDKIRKISSIFSIIGFVDIPLIHYSVTKWGGTHPVVTQGKTISKVMPFEMVIALYSSFFFITVLAMLIVLINIKIKLIDEKFKTVEAEIINNLE